MGQLSLATGLNTNASSGWFVYKPILLSDPDGHHKSQAAACERTPVESEPEQKKGMEGRCSVLCCTMAGLFGGSALGLEVTGLEGLFPLSRLSLLPHMTCCTSVILLRPCQGFVTQMLMNSKKCLGQIFTETQVRPTSYIFSGSCRVTRYEIYESFTCFPVTLG